MGRVTRFIALSVVFAAIPLFVGVAPGGAVRTAHSPKFVGVYTVHGLITGGIKLHGTLTVNADGTATDQFDNVAHWSNSGKTFTATYKHRGTTEVLVGTLTKTGISSKKAPGTVTINDMPAGTWYAVRTS